MPDTPRSKDDFTNPASGLFRDNTSGEISAQDLRDFVESLHYASGSYYFSSPVETVISNQGEWTKVAGSTLTVASRAAATPVNNRLVYTGTPDLRAFVMAAFSMTAQQNNRVFTFGIAKNGMVDPASEITRKVGTGNDVGAMALFANVLLSSGDNVELWVKNDTNDSNVTVEKGHVYAVGLFE